MQLILNGEARTVPDDLTVEALLKHLGFAIQGRAVAVNQTFVPRTRHAAQKLKDGDEVEVVAPMQGG